MSNSSYDSDEEYDINNSSEEDDETVSERSSDEEEEEEDEYEDDEDYRISPTVVAGSKVVPPPRLPTQQVSFNATPRLPTQQVSFNPQPTLPTQQVSFNATPVVRGYVPTITPQQSTPTYANIQPVAITQNQVMQTFVAPSTPVLTPQTPISSLRQLKNVVKIIPVSTPEGKPLRRGVAKVHSNDQEITITAKAMRKITMPKKSKVENQIIDSYAELHPSIRAEEQIRLSRCAINHFELGCTYGKDIQALITGK